MFDRFKSVDIDFNAILKRVLERHEKDIQELIQEQLNKGERGDGTKLPPYTPAYAKRKGKSLTPKTLNDTGEFHKGIFETFFEKSFNIESDNWKAGFLESKWGPNLLNLSEKNKAKLLYDMGVGLEITLEVKKDHVQILRYAGGSVS